MYSIFPCFNSSETESVIDGQCLQYQAQSESIKFHKSQCGAKIDGAICEHEFLEPKYVGCHAYIEDSEEIQDVLKLRKEDSAHRQRGDCRLHCQGKSYFQISRDLNCTCLAKWPTGGIFKY